MATQIKVDEQDALVGRSDRHRQVHGDEGLTGMGIR